MFAQPVISATIDMNSVDKSSKIFDQYGFDELSISDQQVGLEKFVKANEPLVGISFVDVFENKRNLLATPYRVTDVTE